MAIFYKSGLLKCETYEDFKETLGGEYHSVGYLNRSYDEEGSYNVDDYSKVFKGFNPEWGYSSYLEDNSDLLRKVCYYELAHFTSPIFNVKNKTVTYFESLEKRDKGVRSNPTKMGKFFRKIAPYFNDKQIEFLVNYTVSYFAENNYTHNITTGKEITTIYVSKAERGRYLNNYSCINASCMRHNNWSVHPTEVYATESWELHYLTNEEGDIAARALVCKEDDVYSYIYASCEQSGNVLKEKLQDLGFMDVEYAHKPFDGASLLKIEGNGGLVAPYIDYHCEVKDCKDHLEITYGYADYSFSNVSGYVEYETTCECAECGCEHDEDDMVLIGYDLYCCDCTFFCNHFEEYVAGESFEVFYTKYFSYTVCEGALSDMGAVYNEQENEWQTAEWYEECTKEDEEEDTEIEIQPKKEIAPGVNCVVISNCDYYHYYLIGTVVKVTRKIVEGVWDCEDKLGFSQNIEAKDLVVVE